MNVLSVIKKTAALSMQQSFVHKSDALDFFDLGGLALAFAQIVQLGTANFTAANHVNMIHTGRIDRESTFNADAVGHAAHRECFADPAVAFCNNCTFESLQTFAVSFNNLDPYTYGIADAELGQIAADLFCFDGTDDFVHGLCLLPS